MSDHHSDCPVVLAMGAWFDKVAIQEEHGQSADHLDFEDTAVALGFPQDHVECLIAMTEVMVENIFAQRNAAEAYVVARSTLLQLCLVSFAAGRQEEGAIL